MKELSIQMNMGARLISVRGKRRDTEVKIAGDFLHFYSSYLSVTLCSSEFLCVILLLSQRFQQFSDRFIW